MVARQRLPRDGEAAYKLIYSAAAICLFIPAIALTSTNVIATSHLTCNCGLIRRLRRSNEPEVLWASTDALRRPTNDRITCQTCTYLAGTTLGLAEVQCAAHIRCPSYLHQAPFLCCDPGRWCELGYMQYRLMAPSTVVPRTIAGPTLLVCNAKLSAWSVLGFNLVRWNDTCFY